MPTVAERVSVVEVQVANLDEKLTKLKMMLIPWAPV